MGLCGAFRNSNRGRMPECIWDEWYRTLKYKLTKSLGYEIGELEEGYDFQ